MVQESIDFGVKIDIRQALTSVNRLGNVLDGVKRRLTGFGSRIPNLKIDPKAFQMAVPALNEMSDALSLISPEFAILSRRAEIFINKGKQLGDVFKTVGFNATKSAAAIGLVTAALAGVAASVALTQKTLSSGQQFEDMEYQMTALINSSTKFSDSIEENLNQSLLQAKTLIRQFIKDAPKLAGTTMAELTRTASMALGQITGLGIADPVEQAKLIESMTVAVKTITKGAANAEMQLGSEIRGLIGLDFRKTNLLINQLAQKMGGEAQFKQMYETAKKAGKAGEFLLEQLDPYVRAANFASGSLSNAFEVLDDVSSNFFKTVSDVGALETAKGVLGEIAGVFTDMDTKSETFGQVSKEMQNMAKEMGRNLAIFMETLKPLAAPLTDLGVQLMRVLSQLGAVAGQVLQVLNVLLAPIIEIVAQIFKGMGDSFQGLINALNPIASTFNKMAKALAGLAKEGTIVGETFQWVGKILGVALLGMINPLLGILAALGMALSALSPKFQELGEEAQKSWQKVIIAGEEGSEEYKTILSKLTKDIDLSIQETTRLWEEGGLSWWTKTKIILGGLVTEFGSSFTLIWTKIRLIWNQIETTVFSTLQKIREAILGFVGSLPGIGQQMRETVEALAPELMTGSAFGTTFGKTPEALAAQRKRLEERAKKEFSDIINASAFRKGLPGLKLGKGTTTFKPGGEDKPDKKAADKLAKLKEQTTELERALELQRAGNNLDKESLEIEAKRLQARRELNSLQIAEEEAKIEYEDNKRTFDIQRKQIELAYQRREITKEQKIAAEYQIKLQENELDKGQEILQLENQKKELLLEAKEIRFDIEEQLLAEKRATLEVENAQKKVNEAKQKQATAKTPSKQQEAYNESLRAQKELEAKQASLNELQTKNLQTLGLQSEEQRKKLLLNLEDEKTTLEKLKSEGLLTAEQKKQLTLIKKRIAATEEKYKDIGTLAQQDLQSQMQDNQKGFFEGFSDAGKGLFSDIVSAFREGGDDAGEKIMEALRNFGNKAFDMISDKLLGGIFGGQGGSGLFSGLFGGGGGTKLAGGQNLAKTAGGTWGVFGQSGDLVKDLGTKCFKQAKSMSGTGGGILSSILGGGGGFGSILAPVAAIGAIAGIGFSVFSAFKSKKKKREQEKIKKLIEQYKKSMEALAERINDEITGLTRRLKDITRTIGKLDMSSSIFNIQKGIDESMKAINEIIKTKEVLGREAIMGDAETRKTRDALLQLGGKGMEGAVSVVSQWQKTMGDIEDKLYDLDEQTKDWLDKIEEFIQRQQQLIYDFENKVGKAQAEMVFGDVGGDMYDQVVAFNEEVNNLLLSGFDPEKVAFLIERQGLSLQRELADKVQGMKDSFFEDLLALNQELTGVISEGRITGRIQQTQQDRIEDIRNRIDALYKKQQETANSELAQFGTSLEQANEALKYFTEMMKTNYEDALAGARAGTTLTERVVVDMYTPNQIADMVEKKLKVQPWLTGAVI